MADLPASDVNEQQLREACARLVRQVRAGRAGAAEELLRELPALAERPEQAVELIYTEFVTRAQLGQQPAEADFLARFPQYHDVLLQQLEVHRLVCDETVVRTDAAPRGTRLGPYELLSEIARGSMGVVYRARHRELNRPTAIKMIQTGGHVGADELERFRREAEAVARLAHASIVQVYEVGQDDGRPYLALELVSGGSLADKLQGKPQAARASAELVETLARAMAHAHEQGILHRDLKPANVLLQPGADRNSLGAPKIADFGLARLMETPAASLETGALAGTPSYMAPEQATPDGTLGPATDVYALGAILYELLTGRPPFLADTPLHTLAQVVHDEPIAPGLLVPGVPVDLATICLKCLSKEPRQRYLSALELADDLRRFLDGLPIQARPVGQLERAWKWSRRNRAAAGLMVVSGLAVLGIVVGVALFTLHLREVADNERHLKSQALARADELRAQLYTIQLAQVGDLWETDPGRALALLEDEERCPHESRDLAWRVFYAACRQDIDRDQLSIRDPTRLLLARDWLGSLAASADRIVIKYTNLGKHHAYDLVEEELTEPIRAWRPDKTGFTYLDRAGSLRVWDVRQLRAVQSKKLTAAVRLAAFSADGSLLAVYDEARMLQLVDMNSTGLNLNSSKVVWKLGPIASVDALAFSKDRRRLAVAGSPDLVLILDATTGKELARRQLDKPGPITSLAFHPDGSEVAVAVTLPHLVLILKPDDLATTHTLAGHTKAMRVVAYAPDGKLLAAAGDGREIKLWRSADHELVKVFRGHTGIIRDLAFAPSGSWLTTVADDSTLRSWDVNRVNLPESVAGSGRKIVCLDYSGDGSQLVIGDDAGRAFIRDAGGRTATELICHEQSLLCLALSRDGAGMATGSLDGELRLWDLAKRTLRAELKGHKGRLRNVAFSADDRWLASVGDDAIVRVWDVAAGKLVCGLEAGAGPVRSVSFHPAGGLLAAGNDNGTVSIWDLQTRQEVARLQVCRRLILVSLFSPDGKTLACGGLDYTASLWDTETWQRRATLAGHTEYVFAAAFTPDSQTLVTGSGNRFTDVPGEVKLWNVATGQLRATLTGTAGPVAVRRDELATVDDYHTIKLWPARGK